MKKIGTTIFALAFLGFICLTKRLPTKVPTASIRRRRLNDANTVTIQEESASTVVNGSKQKSPISYFIKFEGGVLCGASLISAEHVLTAAHCVDSGFPSRLRLAPTTRSNGIVVDVDRESSAFHPFWNGRVSAGWDVAVMKLSSPVDTSIYKPVKLNEDCFSPVNGMTLTTYGFGRIKDGGSTSSSLQTLDMKVQTFSSTSAFIAAFAAFSSGVCQGDSGGPLVLKGASQSASDIQYGVVSFGVGGCASGQWDGFARVSESYGWIRRQVCARSSNAGRPHFDCSTRTSLKISIRERYRSGVQSMSGVANRFSHSMGFGNVFMPLNGEV